MNLAKYSLDNTKIIYFFLAVLLIGGITSFGKLGKKEDAPFVIKSAGSPKSRSNCNLHFPPVPSLRNGTNCDAKCSIFSRSCPAVLPPRPSPMISATYSAFIMD